MYVGRSSEGKMGTTGYGVAEPASKVFSAMETVTAKPVYLMLSKR